MCIESEKEPHLLVNNYMKDPNNTEKNHKTNDKLFSISK